MWNLKRHHLGYQFLAVCRRRFVGIAVPPALALAARALRPLPFAKWGRAVCTRRFMFAMRRGEFARAERIVTEFASYQSPPFDVVEGYIERVLKKGRASHPETLAAAPALDPEHRPLLRAALLSINGRREDALAMLGPGGSTFAVRRAVAVARRNIHHQMRNHSALAAEGMEFLDAEKDRILIRFAFRVATSAEAVGRDDIFGRAIARIISDRDRMSEDPESFRRFWQEAEAALMSLFDPDGALDILKRAGELDLPKAKPALENALRLREEVRPLTRLIEAARQDVLRKAKLLPGIGEAHAVLFILPSAVLRSNPADYQTFRSDLRFAILCITDSLEARGVPYGVKGRIFKHGAVDPPVPFFAYHTYSNQDAGLHFKETDRPSCFSFDNRGYSGWSEFSTRSLACLDLSRVDPVAAEVFFRQEQSSVIPGNISKYAQAGPTFREELPERYVFVALQVSGDTVEKLAWMTPFEMIDEITGVCERLGLGVLVKRHPLCRSPTVREYLKQQVAADRITLAAGSIHPLIANAEAVCVINSGVGAEALLHEKPVYVFGRAEYMAACFVCRSPGDFAARFVPGKLPLSQADLHRFWFLLRNEHAVHLANRDLAREWIAGRVRRHLDGRLQDIGGVGSDEPCLGPFPPLA